MPAALHWDDFLWRRYENVPTTTRLRIHYGLLTSHPPISNSNTPRDISFYSPVLFGTRRVELTRLYKSNNTTYVDEQATVGWSISEWRHWIFQRKSEPTWSNTRRRVVEIAMSLAVGSCDIDSGEVERVNDRATSTQPLCRAPASWRWLVASGGHVTGNSPIADNISIIIAANTSLVLSVTLNPPQFSILKLFTGAADVEFWIAWPSESLCGGESISHARRAPGVVDDIPTTNRSHRAWCAPPRPPSARHVLLSVVGRHRKMFCDRRSTN